MAQPDNDIKTIATDDYGSDGYTNKEEPTGLINTEGYGKQSLPYQQFNYLINNHGDWLEYLYSEYIPDYIDPITTAITVSDTDATANNDFTVTNDLAVSGDTSLTGTLSLTGAATLSSTLGVTGDTSLSGSLAVTEEVSCSDTLEVTGATTLNSTLTVEDTTSVQDLTVATTLDVTGAVSLSGDISGDGTSISFVEAAEFSDTVSMESTLDVTGEVTTATGVTIGGDLSVTGEATVDGSDIITEATFTGNQSLVQSGGYQLLPGGLILQWGSATVSADTQSTITLPTTFPTTGVSCVASTYINETDDADGMGCIFNGTSEIYIYNGQNGSRAFTYFALGY